MKKKNGGQEAALAMAPVDRDRPKPCFLETDKERDS